MGNKQVKKQQQAKENRREDYKDSALIVWLSSPSLPWFTSSCSLRSGRKPKMFKKAQVSTFNNYCVISLNLHLFSILYSSSEHLLKFAFVLTSDLKISNYLFQIKKIYKPT